MSVHHTRRIGLLFQHKLAMRHAGAVSKSNVSVASSGNALSGNPETQAVVAGGAEAAFVCLMMLHWSVLQTNVSYGMYTGG